MLEPLLKEYPDGPVANLLAGNLAVADRDYQIGLERLLRAEGTAASFLRRGWRSHGCISIWNDGTMPNAC
jgi:hypothetical protein